MNDDEGGVTKAYAEGQRSEEEIRQVFRLNDPEKDGWMWTSYAQYSPSGNVIGQIGFLICPLCMAMIANVPDDVEPGSRLDWPQGHLEWHVERGG